MKHLKRIILILLTVSTISALLSSCVDMGVGDDEEAFKKYFSSVILLSHEGRTERSIGAFNASITYENSTDIKEVVNCSDYCYIAFQVSDGYTLVVDEFAFYAKTDGSQATLELEFYVTDEIPTKIENGDSDVYFPGTSDGDNSVYIPETDSTSGEIIDRGESEKTDTDIFTEDKKYYTDSMKVSSKWSSVLLEFDTKQTVNEGEYIVIRIKNNCESADESQRIRFTINYLMFHFEDAKQN